METPPGNEIPGGALNFKINIPLSNSTENSWLFDRILSVSITGLLITFRKKIQDGHPVAAM